MLQCVAVCLSPPTHEVLKNPAIMPASEPAGLTVVAIVGKEQFWLRNAVCCSVLQCVAVAIVSEKPFRLVKCSVLQSVPLCCSVLQSVLQCVAVAIVSEKSFQLVKCSVLRCVVVCCSALQMPSLAKNNFGWSNAECCNVLQHVAVYCSCHRQRKIFLGGQISQKFSSTVELYMHLSSELNFENFYPRKQGVAIQRQHTNFS